MRRRDSLYDLVNPLIGGIIRPDHPVAMSRRFSGQHLGQFGMLSKVLFGGLPFVIGELAFNRDASRAARGTEGAGLGGRRTVLAARRREFHGMFWIRSSRPRIHFADVQEKAYRTAARAE
jgi:hypothetical protein